ncbi:MAG: type II toxin-antitoxin system VapC family toxin [Deltaproteobacteria bacterium]|jgi:predicted nucleic acid-binding protein|nr:type II toxin-antitoxin system VapC family toxin [Deltaproteobacteria bacterium]
MNVVDSSAWLEYLADGPHAEHFSDPLIDIDNLIVPTICMYEVFKAVLRQRGEDAALQAVALMKQGNTIDLTDDLALQAAKISLEYKIPMADSITLATALAHEAVLWTQNQDFQDMENVNYFPKNSE